MTVFGSAQPLPGSDGYEQARQLGALLARAGFTVVNGGYSGTMQGASQGAREAGGQAVGITCALFDERRPGGNPYLSETVHTPDLLARLRLLLERGDAYVVLDGGVGTLLELFLVWNLLTIGTLHKPCVLVGEHWQRVLEALVRETRLRADHLSLLHVVDTVPEVVDLLRQALA